MIIYKPPGDLTLQELDAVMQIWLEANQEAHSFVPVSYFKDNFESVEKQICQADIWLYKTKDGQVIGFAGVVDGYLAGLFVDASARRKGIGAKLLHACLQTTIALRLHVYAKNKGAVCFYRNNGFSIIAENINPDTQELEYEMQFTVAE